MHLSRKQTKFGTLQRDLPPLKDAIDYQLTKAPLLYLFVERFREWANWDKRVYLSFVHRGDIVLDVGANVGAHTIFLSHLAGAHGRVIAFEPLPANIAALKDTVRRRARYTNISIVPAAVGDSHSNEGTATLKIPGDDHTQASLAVQIAGSWELRDFRELEVPLVSLDTSTEVHILSHLELVKIDVEGGELDVLRGASRTLSQHMPLIYCEAYEKWQAPFGYNSADLIEFARSLGYLEARVFSGGTVHPIRLNDGAPRSLFVTSADILFFADTHRNAVERFDRRYRIHNSSR
ncbi:MAG: FkbM family methyltransferase [Gemmatimonadaceae bacterium]